jgi:hypothetical protein
MSTQVLFPPFDLECLVSEIRLSRKITRQDQYLLMRLGSQVDLSDRQTTLLHQLYDLLRQGCIRVVD